MTDNEKVNKVKVLFKTMSSADSEEYLGEDGEMVITDNANEEVENTLNVEK